MTDLGLTGGDFFEQASLAVDDETTDDDVGGDQRVGADGLDGAMDRLVGVLEAFEPVSKVDATLADSVERLVSDATGKHLVVEMVVAHVAGTAMRVCHDHDVGNAQLVDGNDEATHGRIECRYDESSRVFDYLGIAVLQSESSREQLGKACVHAGEDGQFFVGIFVG